jgi:hypothetical protein
MKRTHYKTCPDWRQRESRMLIWSIGIGAVAAAVAALVIYFANRGN